MEEILCLSLKKLTEGIVRRDLAKEGAALLNKWERTGLLEGLDSDHSKNNMASLLENQAKELLREASLMSQGDVEGFAAVAFPIVRRVFGSLIANDLVSVQPMSLPSGLIFFLDFKFAESQHDSTGRLNNLDYDNGDSIYGQGVLGSELTGGVSIDEDKQPYGFQTGYSSATGSIDTNAAARKLDHILSGTFGAGGTLDKLVKFDPDFVSGTTFINVYKLDLDECTQIDKTEGGLANLVVSSSAGKGQLVAGLATNQSASVQVRRHTQLSSSSTRYALLFTTGAADNEGADIQTSGCDVEFIIADAFTEGSGLGSVAGDSAGTWGLEASSDIPEIEIKVDSVSVTARTKKLKAKWSPELGQDLNAYHNLDAEVELTSILSEQIALELDREILADLIQGAKVATYYWSRSPGMFVHRETGVAVTGTNSPDFTGNVSEWYETLIETINDVSAQIHRKTLRGGANFLVCGLKLLTFLSSPLVSVLTSLTLMRKVLLVL